jgi:hypothetical protein
MSKMANPVVNAGRASYHDPRLTGATPMPLEKLRASPASFAAALELHHDVPDVVQRINVRRILLALKSSSFTLEIRPLLLTRQLGCNLAPAPFATNRRQP